MADAKPRVALIFTGGTIAIATMHARNIGRQIRAIA